VRTVPHGLTDRTGRVLRVRTRAVPTSFQLLGRTVGSGGRGDWYISLSDAATTHQHIIFGSCHLIVICLTSIASGQAPITYAPHCLTLMARTLTDLAPPAVPMGAPFPLPYPTRWHRARSPFTCAHMSRIHFAVLMYLTSFHVEPVPLVRQVPLGTGTPLCNPKP
jgi:hypothetical protein